MKSDRSVFTRVAPVVDFPDAESRIRAFWREHGIFEKSLALRSKGPRFVFYEGPPTANGMPHNGHALTRVMKDVIPRYKAMRGFDVPRRAGWDTHGLAVEIEAKGAAHLRARGDRGLRLSSLRAPLPGERLPLHRGMAELHGELAFWLDLDDAYVTYHQSYVESVWWALSRPSGARPALPGPQGVWWWAQAALCSRPPEVGEAYKSVDDPSLYVRFPLRDEPGTSLLCWTTTPWTLPSNSFAAVKADVDYAVVQDGEQRLIVAAALRETLAEKVGRELPVLRTLRGSELVGARYEPPFDWYAKRLPGADLWRVVAADFVELDAGTGVVHAAPAFGEVDFELLQSERKAGPELPLLCAVRPDGSFDPEIADASVAGRWVKDADRDLLRQLKERELAWHVEQIRHDSPTACLRPDPADPVRASGWYIRTSAHVDAALANTRRSSGCPSTSATAASAIPAQQRGLGALARALLGHAAEIG